MHRLALASINQAVDSLNLSDRILSRIKQVTIVGNVAMHHLLVKYPLETLAAIPFQPHSSKAIKDATNIVGSIFPSDARVALPPLIGGFVGSDALACLAYFGFNNAPFPMAAIDLGTNGEVMVTDGNEILTASTAAGPAFEGVNISCGTRAIDGAVVAVNIDGPNFLLETIGEEEPIGLTGSGLLSAVNKMQQHGLIETSGRITKNIDQKFVERIHENNDGIRSIILSSENNISLTQLDIRELQKAKGAIRAAINILMKQLGLKTKDLQRVILTGSFGGQVDIDAATGLGMIPPVDPEIVETVANGAGLGAAMFLTEEGFELGVSLANRARQVDLDLEIDFEMQYVNALSFSNDDLPMQQ
jgi:uncharacterized 2Fe-2S/4Fe-4S cluster protein (DUF4445 family)